MCCFTESMRHPYTRLGGLGVVLIAGAVWFAGCKGSDGTGGGSATRLNGGGATFVDGIMQKWASEYQKVKGVRIDYVASGSGRGVTEMTDKINAFGCSDAPMSKKEMEAAAAKGGEVINVPIVMGSVAIIYHVPGVDQQLKLSGPVLADIYLGRVRKWNDKALVDLNPGVTLPASDIIPIRRAEGSGTSYIFTDYLSKVSPEFAKTVGVSKDPKWPDAVAGGGQRGNDGIAGFVQKNAGSIGYVELHFARTYKLSYASLKNAEGLDVAPTAEGVVAAAEAAMRGKVAEEPYALHEHAYPLTNTDGEKAYPICGMSFLVLYKKQPAARGAALKEFLKWATTEGQQYAEALDYAPLPKALADKLQVVIDRIEPSN